MSCVDYGFSVYYIKKYVTNAQIIGNALHSSKFIEFAAIEKLYTTSIETN